MFWNIKWKTLFLAEDPLFGIFWNNLLSAPGTTPKGQKSLTPSETWTLMKSNRKWAVPKLTGISPFIEHIHIFYCTHSTFYWLHSVLILLIFLFSFLVVRFRKPTLIEHSNSQQHRDAISAEHLQRVSTFHSLITEKENTAHNVLFNALYSLYWLGKKEIPNRKFTLLLSLLVYLGLEEMKYLTHRSPCAVREMFLVVGQVMLNSILQKLHNANYWGL